MKERSNRIQERSGAKFHLFAKIELLEINQAGIAQRKVEDRAHDLFADRGVRGALTPDRYLRQSELLSNHLACSWIDEEGEETDDPAFTDYTSQSRCNRIEIKNFWSYSFCI